MYRNLVVLSLFLFSFAVSAQDYKNWVKYAPRLTDDFLLTDTATQLAQRVIDSQLSTGAWPKNINFFQETSSDKDSLLGTIDNGATLTEIRFLMRLFAVRNKANEEYKKQKSAENIPFPEPIIGKTEATAGIKYLLKMQYPNGGFPQYYPRTDHYHAYITFNDYAMVGAMRLLHDVADRAYPFEQISDTLALQCKEAYNRGVGCILKCQIKIDSVLTLWCQQHDPSTFEPRPARAYEHAWIVTAESVGILRLLMDEVNNQTTTQERRDSIGQAIKSGLKWLESHAIHGYKRENYVNADGLKDYRYVPCEKCRQQGLPLNQCPHLPRFWSRFYTLDTQQPVFCGRDAVPRSKVEDIDYDRRNGYAWFVTQPETIFVKANNTK